MVPRNITYHNVIEISPLCLPEIDYILSLFVDTPR